VSTGARVDTTGLRIPVGILAGFAALAFLALVAYRPDRPVATIPPGSSSGPAFVVQVVRPRAGLPLGGLVPPELFGVDARLGFDSSSAGASVGSVGPRRLELAADGWELVVLAAADERVSPDSHVVFDLMFEERERRVRCRPADPAVGAWSTTALPAAGELAGDFEIELARCEDAASGEPLGWPPSPLVLRGSFDRLAATSGR
jgi:hypothetical protein